MLEWINSLGMVKSSLLIFAVVLIPTSFGGMYYYRMKKLKQSGKLMAVKAAKLEKRFNFLMNNFLTRKAFNNLVRSYVALSCLTQKQVHEKSVKLFTRSVVVSLIIPLGLMVAEQDVIITLMGFLIALVYYNLKVTSSINQMYNVIMGEVSTFVSSLQVNYLEYNNIPRAVLEADGGQYLNLVINDIYNILVSLQSQKALQEFVSKTPLKILAEIALVCQVTNEYGDTYDNRGSSKFIEQLGVIEKEINLDIRIAHKQKIMFASLDKIALAGIVMMPIVDYYLLSNMPGTSVFIKGIPGEFIKCIIILVTVVAYYVISVVNTKSVAATTDFSELVYNISQRKKFRPILQAIKPKKYKTLLKVEYRLQGALSANTLDTLYTSKLLFAVITTIFVLVATIVFCISAKVFVYNNTGTLSLIPETLPERVYEDVIKMDKKYMSLEEKPMGDALKDFVRNSVDLNELDVEKQAARLQKKWDIYQATGFHWYYLVLAWVCGLIGWFVPDLKILLRKREVMLEAYDDASQLQTVMITLSGTGLSVYEILFRLLDISTIHRGAISYCTQTFIRDPGMALEVLAQSSSVTDFKRMCLKLKESVFDLDIRDAFRNIVTEKEQALSIREMDMLARLESKANLATKLAFGPTVAVIGLQVLGSLGYLALTQLTSVSGSLNAI